MGLRGIKLNDEKFQVNGNNDLYWRIDQFYGVNFDTMIVSARVLIFPNKTYADEHPSDYLEERRISLPFGPELRDQYLALGYATMKEVSETIEVEGVKEDILPYAVLADVLET